MNGISCNRRSCVSETPSRGGGAGGGPMYLLQPLIAHLPSLHPRFLPSGACKLPLLSLSCWFAVHSPPGLADLLSPCLPLQSQPNASSESHGLLAASLRHPQIPQTPQRLLTKAPPRSAGDSSACHPDNSAIVLSSTLAAEPCLGFV